MTNHNDLPGLCEFCGEPMPSGETMFKYHGYSGPCPKPPKEKPKEPDYKWEYENICKFATQYEEERDKLQAELATAKEQLAWNLQNNDEFGCEFVGIVILKQEIAKRDARIEKLRAGLKEYSDMKQSGRMTHYWAVTVLAKDDKMKEGES